MYVSVSVKPISLLDFMFNLMFKINVIIYLINIFMVVLLCHR